MSPPFGSVETRRHDIDWLRVFAVYLLFIFHVAMVFNPAPFYHIRNDELSFGMLVFAGFISLWHMPLLFLLAGWSLLPSLQARGSGGFLKERVLKLFVPLVAGCALFGPAIKYLELRTGLDASYTGLRVSQELQESFKLVIPQGLPVAAPFDESFLEFLPSFFTDPDRFTWAHLWFLAYLFTFSLLYQPLFQWLRNRRDRLTRARAIWVYLPIVPLALTQVTLRERWPGLQNLYDDWANFAYYSTFLITGFLLSRYPTLEEAVQREWKRAFCIALAAMGVLLASVIGLVTSTKLLLAGTAVAGWCFVVGLLGLARTRFRQRSAPLAYLAESALPIYILHQPAIVLIGYWIVQLRLGIAPKYALLLVGSVALALAMYHFVVRPIPVLRFLHGMKPKKRGALATPGGSSRRSAEYTGSARC
jgi:peptidoglycan/LPS O-acetylase OafA/YrhL